MYTRGNPIKYSDPSGYEDFIFYSSPAMEGKMHKLIAYTLAKGFKKPIVRQISSIKMMLTIIGNRKVDHLITVSHGAEGILYLSQAEGVGNLTNKDIREKLKRGIRFNKLNDIQVQIYACQSYKIALEFTKVFGVKSLGLRTYGEYSGKRVGKPGKNLPSIVPEDYQGDVYMVPYTGKIEDFVVFYPQR